MFLHKENLKSLIHCFAWFVVVLVASLPPQVHADLCTSSDENWCRRENTAFVVAGMTVFAAAGVVAWLASGSGHRGHHSHFSGSSYVGNYRPHSDSSHSSDYSYWDHHHHDHNHLSGHHHHHNHSGHHHHHHFNDHHHHSCSYSSNPYSIFSANDVSSWNDDSDHGRNDFPFGRTHVAKSSLNPQVNSENILEGRVMAASAALSGGNKSMTAFVQLPDGSSRTLGSLPLSGNASIPFGPFDQKGVYTFGVSLDQGNESSVQTKLATIEMVVNGNTVQRVDFSAPPHAPARYEPSPYCFDLSSQ